MKKLLILLLISPLLVAGEIYKWTDKNGKTHYSDKPPENQQVTEIDQALLERTANSVSFVTVEILPIDFPVNRQANQVVMYSTQRCKYCARARRYFSEKNIDYIEKDIQLSKKAREEYDKAGGRGVPLIFIGKYKVTGFNKAKFAKIYEQLFGK